MDLLGGGTTDQQSSLVCVYNLLEGWQSKTKALHDRVNSHLAPAPVHLSVQKQTNASR